MRNRNVQIKFFLSPEEVLFLEKKMQVAGIKNKSAYLRTMALDGYIINLDFSELKEFINALNRIGNNLNQIAKVANTYGEVSMPEVYEFEAEVNKIFGKIDKVIRRWLNS
ncbi:plasmid mobilization protein [Caproicibacter sp.]|uniref:plasmid mobilization protein n=1 Tax=Caproicibacter sp. TaxID=2814884 RepID=UPI003989C5F0